VCHPGSDLYHETHPTYAHKVCQHSPAATCTNIYYLPTQLTIASDRHISRWMNGNDQIWVRDSTPSRHILILTRPPGQVGSATSRRLRAVSRQNSQRIYAPISPLARRFRQHLHLCRMRTRYPRAKLAACVHTRIRGLRIALEEQMGSSSDESISVHQLLRRSLASTTVPAADESPVLVRSTEEP
jgi:hypothetical protein